MSDGRITLHKLTLIYNSNIRMNCSNTCEEIEVEIVKLLFEYKNKRIVGIIGSESHTSLIYLYKIVGGFAEPFAYLFLQCKDDNKVMYSFSQSENEMGNLHELDILSNSYVANTIIDELNRMIDLKSNDIKLFCLVSKSTMDYAYIYRYIQIDTYDRLEQKSLQANDKEVRKCLI